MNDLRDKTLIIPDYQRDGDQWEEPTRSLLVESVINNLTIPAFFFEVAIGDDGVERNEVVDGQQRLTTLHEFSLNKLRLVGSDDAPYLSPNSVHYAGKTYDELPESFRQAFKKYRMTIIKLRALKGMRLEVFRRINQGGTPLSGQDIRLAYYGQASEGVTFIRLAGIYDPDRTASKRFIDNASQRFKLGFPWTDADALDTWKDWWAEKEIARGQTASEMFLWALLTADVQKLEQLLQNQTALGKINVRFNRAIAEAMDAYCAQLAYQDHNVADPALLMDSREIREKFFPYFMRWFHILLGQKGLSLPVGKHRTIACVIGAAYRSGIKDPDVRPDGWTRIVEFVRRPTDVAKKHGAEWPQSKGKWDGQRGYRAQLDAAASIIPKLVT